MLLGCIEAPDINSLDPSVINKNLTRTRNGNGFLLSRWPQISFSGCAVLSISDAQEEEEEDRDTASQPASE